MKEHTIHTADLTETNKRQLEGFDSHIMENKQKEKFLIEDRKVIYSGMLTNVYYLGEDTFEYTIDGYIVKALYPLERSLHISSERHKTLTDVPVQLEGLALKEEHSILLLRLTYPEQVKDDSIVDAHQLELPQSIKNMILYFTEVFKFCAFIFTILLAGQIFDDNGPERYEILTYVAGGFLLAFIGGYFFIASRKKSWMRPVPVMHFKGTICQILAIVDNSGDIASDQVMYITGDRSFITWLKNTNIHPGNKVVITYKRFSNVGSTNTEKPDVQKIQLI